MTLVPRVPELFIRPIWYISIMETILVFYGIMIWLLAIIVVTFMRSGEHVPKAARIMLAVLIIVIGVYFIIYDIRESFIIFFPIKVAFTGVFAFLAMG